MIDALSKASFHALANSRSLQRLASRYGMAGPRSFARRFIAGETLEEAIAAARAVEARGLTITLDYLGESAATLDAAEAATCEYLRIVERDGGVVYVAQPGGARATEFVLTELSKNRAVFENPRHDFPRRIVYELSAEGGLSATIGQLKGGTPNRFEWKREGGEK